MKPPFSFLLFVLILLLSCQPEKHERLDCVEMLLSEAPDSALCILSQINPKSFFREKDKARYALLKSAALDKNYIDVTSDSLTRRAVDYYSLHSNKYYRMLAWYYHGLVLMNARSYSSSIVAFEKAEKDAIELRDDYHCGLILRNKANVFNMTNNFLEAINCQHDAIHHFEKAGRNAHLSFAKLDLGIFYTNNQDYRLADSLFLLVLQKYDNPVLVHYCNTRQAGILVELDMNSKDALSLYQKVPKSYYCLQDYAYLALAHERLNHKDSADFWITEGYRYAQNKADSATLDFPRSRLELMRGNPQKAFLLINHAASVQDSLTRILLQQSVSTAQRDYYKSETLLQEERIRSLRQRAVFGAVLIFFIVSILALTAIFHSRKKEQVLKEEMARVTLKERELERVNKDNAHLVGSLFSEKINHFDKLSESYFRMEEGKEKEVLFQQIKALASTIRNDDALFLSLEKDLDRYCNGIMSKIRLQVPRIKGENLKIIALFFAGFSYETVKFILNKYSIESLKTARSRYRKEIKDAHAPDADFFLKMLEMKKRPQAGTNEKG